MPPPIRIAAIGLAHPHVFTMTQHMLDAGAELVAFEPEDHVLGQVFGAHFSDAEPRREPAAILEDRSIDAILGAGVPAERAALGLEVLRHEKDFVSDKPGFTSLGQLEEARRVCAETDRRFLVWFSERLDSRATVHASELVRDGAIGRVLQTVGLGPHRLDAAQRPPWFFERARTGGILTDLASHQMDQFLHFTGATTPEVRFARTANRGHPEHRELEDFGEAIIDAEGASGYVRVDWFTPQGLPTWGDGRLLVIGTAGQIEVRKNVDLAGREGAEHLFLIDESETRYVDCQSRPLPFATHLLEDLVRRTETAITQEHCFRASELALRAQAAADALRADIP